MSTVIRPSSSRPLGGTRPEVERTVDADGRPAELLLAGRPVWSDPTPTPQRALASDALRMLRLVRMSGEPDPGWWDISFEETVDGVRCHLAPIRSRRNLAGSFAREAFRCLGAVGDREPAPSAEPRDAVRLAYAIRWLELGDDQPRPPWAALRVTRGQPHLRIPEPRHRPAGIRRRPR